MPTSMVEWSHMWVYLLVLVIAFQYFALVCVQKRSYTLGICSWYDIPTDWIRFIEQLYDRFRQHKTLQRNVFWRNYRIIFTEKLRHHQCTNFYHRKSDNATAIRVFCAWSHWNYPVACGNRGWTVICARAIRRLFNDEDFDDGHDDDDTARLRTESIKNAVRNVAVACI